MNGAVLLKKNYEVPIDSSNDFDPIFYYLSLTLLKAYVVHNTASKLF